MPLGGQLKLKGGEVLGGVKKPKKKVKKQQSEEEQQLHDSKQEEQQEPGKTKPIAPTAVNVMSGKNYEQEFDLETQRMEKGRIRNTPWGSNYRKAPEILHGYTKKVTGNTAEERLDMRSATKADRYCK